MEIKGARESESFIQFLKKSNQVLFQHVLLIYFPPSTSLNFNYVKEFQSDSKSKLGAGASILKILEVRAKVKLFPFDPAILLFIHNFDMYII